MILRLLLFLLVGLTFIVLRVLMQRFRLMLPVLLLSELFIQISVPFKWRRKTPLWYGLRSNCRVTARHWVESQRRRSRPQRGQVTLKPVSGLILVLILRRFMRRGPRISRRRVTVRRLLRLLRVEGQRIREFSFVSELTGRRSTGSY